MTGPIENNRGDSNPTGNSIGNTIGNSIGNAIKTNVSKIVKTEIKYGPQGPWTMGPRDLGPNKHKEKA